MKHNKARLGKMMSEFSEELGVTAPEKDRMGKGLLMVAGGILGYAAIRGIVKRGK